MPQLQLPIFPAGVTEINNRIAVQKEAGRVCYLHGHLPVFQHEEQDVRSFRMFTSQMIVGGTVKPKEIAKTFGVPMITVKRYMKLYRDEGAKGFYEAKPRHSSASVLKCNGPRYLPPMSPRDLPASFSDSFRCRVMRAGRAG